MEVADKLKVVWRIVFLLILVGVLFGVLTWTGIIKCNVIPGWCDVYFGVVRYSQGGQPQVAIVYREGIILGQNPGLGNPQLLQQILADPRILGVHADLVDIENLEIGNLKQYDLVIVEQARQIETKKLKVFADYVNQHGGRLVWTGDAGTVLGANDQYLYLEQREGGKALCEDVIKNEGLTPHDINRLRLDCIYARDATLISPWARVREDNSVLNFDQVLGVNYYGNYCELSTAPLLNIASLPPAEQQRVIQQSQQAAANCFQQKRIVGTLLPDPTDRHPLIQGLRSDLPLHGDFAVVEEVDGAYSTRALSVKFDGRLAVREVNSTFRLDFGNVLPVIQTAGVGERVAYYAVPPEAFAEDPMNYISIVENMYVGMVRG